MKPAFARSAGLGYGWVQDLKVCKRADSDRYKFRSGVLLTVGTCLGGLVVSTIVSSTPESFMF